MWMAEAKTRQQWEHTTNIMAMMANQWRDEKKRSEPYQPFEFNPYNSPQDIKRMWEELKEKRWKALPKADMTTLKNLWCKNQGD